MLLMSVTLIFNATIVGPQGGTPMLGGRGAWPKILPLKFLLEPQILPPKI